MNIAAADTLMGIFGFTREKKMKSITEYQDGSFILIAAFRYSLGRATYASSILVETILNEWDNLTDGDKKLFKREIKQAIDHGQAGWEVDVKEWQKILDKEI